MQKYDAVDGTVDIWARTFRPAWATSDGPLLAVQAPPDAQPQQEQVPHERVAGVFPDLRDGHLARDWTAETMRRFSKKPGDAARRRRRPDETKRHTLERREGASERPTHKRQVQPPRFLDL